MQKWARVQFQPGTGLGEDGKRVTASKEHIALSREAAEEGMVLLKNTDKCLPLASGSRVALFGKATFDYVKGGGGSGDVTVSYIRNLYEGFQMLGDRFSVFQELASFYRKDVETQYAMGREPGMTQEPVVPEELLGRARAFTDTAVISICRFSGEGWDRKSSYDKKEREIDCGDLGPSDTAGDIFSEGDFYLTAREQELVDAVTERFSKVVVVLNIGGMMAPCWFQDNDKIQGVLLAWQGGMEGGLAAARLLAGLENPSGKLADTFAAKLEDYPSSATFHESDDYVDYTEDVYVGYRYFETIPGAEKQVVYPFGFGLSYTSFALSEAVMMRKDTEFTVCLEVCNTGERAGKEVVQVYCQAPQGKLGKPERQLVAFAKTRKLMPGETQCVKLGFALEQLASYDDCGKVAESCYVLEQGDYHFYVGTSVRDVVENKYVLQLDSDRRLEQLTKRLAPARLSKRLKADGQYEELPLREADDPDANLLTPMTNDEMEGYAPDIAYQAGWRLWNGTKKVRLLQEVAEGACTIEEFLAQLTDRQLAELLGGQPNTGVADTFGFGNLPEYGVPSVMTADGPAGLRIRQDRGVCTTAWPCATLLACSWNTELVERVGAAGGAEVKENNIGVWLTPAVNIHRSPLCGRNFEYYSEDPYLAGKMGAAMVRGIQSNRVGVSLKHFALNNKETNRKDSDSRVSERAAREIYLKPFEIIVKEAAPWTIMSSYNKINGYRASECKELLEDILRGEWGYEGVVTTDWWNRGEQYKELLAGNDIKMGRGYPDRLLSAMEAGAIDRSDLERGARRVLELLLKLD
ncbi:MAG: glycoside hydrolase family 3 C-terminal domain-containing protein [Roseburia sp.]|nr:glycoside hydrolase family 3 C-terminal domain-containing protein [Roseburia sp.]